MLLKNKIAVIYGAGGAIGGAVARAFAEAGATVFLTGRSPAALEALARELVAAGRSVHAASVDALDESAIDRHLESVVARAGRVDISFNAVGIPNAAILGVSYLELDADRFSEPIAAYTRSYFLTARLAARRMVPQKSGVILTLSAIPARTGTPLNGGYGPALAAKEALTRDLSVEFAPHGVRVLALRPHGMPETPMIKKLFEIKARAFGNGLTWEQFQNYLSDWAHAKRTMTLGEVASMAVFLASDQASAVTGTTVNLTLGGVVD